MTPANTNTITSFEDAAVAFADHEGMSLDNVRKWSAQFGVENQQLALKILKNVKYYSATTIREMVEQMLGLICNHLSLRDRRKMLFVPIGKPYEGSAIIARALRSSKGIGAHQIKYQTELAAVPAKPKIRAIVLLDVFSGTGEHISDWWRNMETLLLPWAEKSISLILAILAVNHEALARLEDIPVEKLHVSRLGMACNVLSNKSHVFVATEKELIRRFCRKTKCGSEYLYGKGNCGLLVAFKHGCPNNSLPILWYNSDGWTSIFLRRAL